LKTQELEILLLGPLQLSIAGKPVAGLVSVKAKALLAYLAAARRPCARSTLAGLLWSDLPEEDARRNLRVEISKLRRVLENYLLFTHQEGMLKPGSLYRVDLHDFENCAATLPEPASTPDTSRLVEAAAMYRGDFLSGFQVRAAPLFDEWLLLERERLRQMALTLLDRLIENAIRHQDWLTGLSAARKSVSIDGWREQSHRQLMTLLALSGDRPAALAQFEATRRILVQELGIEPALETYNLHQRIKAGEVAPQAAVAPFLQFETPLPLHNLPAPTSSFVGRETELQYLDELLKDPGCRLLTLTGPGGVGKTRLALEFCWKQAGDSRTPFKDGIYVISLATADGESFVSAIADALKLSGAQDPHQQLIHFLSGKQILLVLDNFEHLAEAAPMLVEILYAADGVKLLITSRHQLDLYEEWILPVEGMPYPLQIEHSGWQAYNAVQLFQQRARQVNLRFALENNRDCIIRLCQLLEGLPLGIELTAAWVNVLPCESIFRQIEQKLTLPDKNIRNLPARQRSLQAVIQYSWDMLMEGERDCLAHLTVFRGGFTTKAAENVAAAHPRLLATLVAKSLLRFSSDGRYEMHSLLHVYSTEKLTSPKKEAVQAAHSHFFAQYLTDHAQDFAGPKEHQAIEAISKEIANIRAGWVWAVARITLMNSKALIPPDSRIMEDGIELLVQYIAILSTFYLRKSWFREAETVFSKAIYTLDALEFGRLTPATRAPFALGLLYLAHAKHCRALGQNKTAHAQITKGLHLLALYPENAEIADAWHNLGQIEQQTGSLAAAEEAYRHSLRIYRTLAQPTGIASNLISQGVLAKNRGDFSHATSLYSECQRIFEALGDQRGIWTCLINLGNIANVQQAYQKAKSLYAQAYACIQNSADISRQALTLVNLGSVAREMDEMEAARQYYLDSLRLGEEIGEMRIQVASLDGLGKTCLKEGNLDAARDYLLRASKFALEANLLPQVLDSFASLGQLVVERGHTEQAAGILAYILAQTYCPDHVRQSAEKEIENLKTHLKANSIRKAEREFQGLTLDAILSILWHMSSLPI
jgi:DNA-binding SARP family transcriptional activator/predicted ATPase